MKWDFWHVVLAFVIAILAVFLIWELVLGIVHIVEVIITPILIAAIVIGLGYLGFRVLRHEASN